MIRVWSLLLLSVAVLSQFGQSSFAADETAPIVKEKVAPGKALIGEPIRPDARKAFIDDTGPGWQKLTLDDFENVNCDPDTWSMRDGLIHCTGLPIGVTRSKEIFKNVEISVLWRHNKHAGNSGMFLWADPQHLKDVPRNGLPKTGIEIQMLDHGYAENFEKANGKKSDWFTTNGDIFALQYTKLTPFEPRSANGSRSFPRKNTTLGHGEWNHYYVRAINGEVRLWVNGEEVSGGTGADPAQGHLLLESEGSPIDFQDLKVRVIP